MFVNQKVVPCLWLLVLCLKFLDISDYGTKMKRLYKRDIGHNEMIVKVHFKSET